jgi:hypothetical protein
MPGFNPLQGLNASAKNLPLQGAAADLGLGTSLVQQVNSQVANQKKLKQPGQGTGPSLTDVLTPASMMLFARAGVGTNGGSSV